VGLVARFYLENQALARDLFAFSTIELIAKSGASKLS